MAAHSVETPIAKFGTEAYLESLSRCSSDPQYQFDLPTLESAASAEIDHDVSVINLKPLFQAGKVSYTRERDIQTVVMNLNLIRKLIPEIKQEQISQLKQSIFKYSTVLFENPEISYPALFSVELLKTKKCFLEVFSSQFVLFLTDDESSVVASGKYKIIRKVVPIISEGPQEILARGVNRIAHREFPSSSTSTKSEEEYYISLTEQPHFVKLFDAYRYSDDMQILLMKYYPDTLLEASDTIRLGESCHYPLTQEFKLDMAINLMEALAFMHSQNILHRDIKLENILIDGDKIGLTDFGFSCDADDSEATARPAGSLHYTSYEIMKDIDTEKRSSINTKASDIWGAGCVLWLWLHNHNYPWYNHIVRYTDLLDRLKALKATRKNRRKISSYLARIKEKSGQVIFSMEQFSKIDLPKEKNPLLRIIGNMLHIDPSRRPSADVVLEQLKLTKSMPLTGQL